VPIPGTDTPLVTFEDTPAGRKQAAKTRDIVGAQQSFLETMAEIRALYEDADRQGVLSSLGVKGTDANFRLSTKIAIAQDKLAKIKAGEGVTSKGDEEWAQERMPSNLKIWSDKERGLKQLEGAYGAWEDMARSQLGRFTRLNTAKREQILKQARKRGVSQTQAAKIVAAEAEKILGDEAKGADARVAAMTNIEEQERASRGHDWIESAGAKIAGQLPKIKDPAVRQDAIERMAKYQRFAQERQQRILDSNPRFAAMIAAGVEDSNFSGAEAAQLAEYRKQEQIANSLARNARRALKSELPESLRKFFE